MNSSMLSSPVSPIAAETHPLAVRSDTDHFIERSEAHIPHESQPIRKIIVVCHHGATLERIQHLRGVKAEDFGVAEVTDHAPLVRAAQRVSGVEQELELVSIRDGGKIIDVARATPKMDGNEPRRARC